MYERFMVLGIHDSPTCPENSEADNPYIFNDLKRAMEHAQFISDTEGFASVVLLQKIYGTPVKPCDI